MTAARRLAPKPQPGPLAERLGRSRHGVARERVSIHAELPTPRPFNYKGIEITILSKGRCVIEKPGIERHGLEVYVTATRNGQPLAIDGHLRFFPPPLMVADGTYRIEVIDGREVEISNHKEDPRAALMEVIGQEIARQAGAP